MVLWTKVKRACTRNGREVFEAVLDLPPVILWVLVHA